MKILLVCLVMLNAAMAGNIAQNLDKTDSIVIEPNKLQLQNLHLNSGGRTSNSELSQEVIAESWDEFQNAKYTYYWGLGSLVGGVGVIAVSINKEIDRIGLYLLGSLAILGGIPVMGMGASKAEQAVMVLDSSHHKSSVGWLFYSVGLGLQVAGFATFMGADDWDGLERGVLVFGTGTVFQGISALVFSVKMIGAGSFIKEMKLEPILKQNQESEIDGGGLSLSFKF